MSRQCIRKPIGNFFIKKELQVRLIWKIVGVVIIATLISALTLLCVYYLKYESVLLYQMDNLANLTKENIIMLILPTILISALANVLVAFIVGLYASRKYAVPIYKLEQWANLVKNGKIAAKLRFREKEEMQELSSRCNDLTETLRAHFTTIRDSAEALRGNPEDGEALKAIFKAVNAFELDSAGIEVRTSILRREDTGD